MKFITLLKSYKLAMYELINRVDWAHHYICSIDSSIEDDDNILTFIFSNTSEASVGSTAAKISFSDKAVSKLDGGIDKVESIEDTSNVECKINDVAKFLLILYKVLEQIRVFTDEDIESAILSSVYIKHEAGTVKFNLILKDQKLSLCTDGNLVLYGEYEQL